MSKTPGRYRKPLDPEALAFSSSLPVDKRLYREDIRGSIAHVRMLARQRIIPGPSARSVERGLRGILRDIETGAWSPGLARSSRRRLAADDIHMAIEERLRQRVGAAAGLLHTARSRNDQIALDERLFLRSTTEGLIRTIRSLQKTLLRLARSHRHVLMPGYTHLQRAQPVLLAHHLLAYVAMFDRDAGRFADCRARANRSPLGAAALAGSPFPIDRASVARTLGFDGVEENSIDAVSDRDGLLEFLAACSIAMMHLSRLAEDLILWSTREWSFVRLGEDFTTGSSIMPQKANPDIAELIRGKSGRVFGDLMTLLTVMKGLPLSYNRDLQEDKEPVFDAGDTLHRSLHLMSRMLSTARFDADRFSEELHADPLMATELADYLARAGMPFRKAHGIVGDLVREALRRGCTLPELPFPVYRKHSALFRRDLYDVLDPAASVRRKRSSGSTNPSMVVRAIAQWERRLARTRRRR